MKILVIVALFAVMAVPVAAEEIETEVITVQTGWTTEKAFLAETWTGFSNAQRQTNLLNLETRMSEIRSKLPENVYSPEEEKLVGYRIRLEQTHEQLINAPSAWHYAEYAALLDEADNFVWYTEREASLPRTAGEEQGAYGYDNQGPSRPAELLQGTGWANGYVDQTYTDHLTLGTASFENYVFACAHNPEAGTGQDTMFLWQSTDYGNNWSLFHSYGTSTADRWPFDLVVDPVNERLYDAYRYVTSSITGNIWVRHFTDFTNGSATSIDEIEGTTDACNQPHLSVEHQYVDHRICCMYYNQNTDNLVIARSSDYGNTWTIVHTTAWTNANFPKLKSAQGASAATTDKFYFVGQKAANTFTIFESTSGLSGSWTETDYVHGQDIGSIDISASHNHNDASVVVAFEYEWNATDFNIRILFRPEGNANFISVLVDGDGIMCKTPVISCDGEYALNNAGPDYYHLSYYKDNNDDGYYIPFALRSLNDSTSLAGMRKDVPTYFEVVGTTAIDTLAAIWDFGTPLGYYQMDMTTIWNSTWSQWFPAILWLRFYAGQDADPRLAFPDEDLGVWEMPGNEPVASILNLTPNPSRNSAELSYVVAQQGYVNISVYDATGRMIQTLVHGNKSAGEYSLSMNNENLASGVYFVKVETPEGTAGKTMMIIR